MKTYLKTLTPKHMEFIILSLAWPFVIVFGGPSIGLIGGTIILMQLIILWPINWQPQKPISEQKVEEKYMSRTHTAYLIKKELTKLPEEDRVNPENYANELAETLISQWEADRDLLRTSITQTKPYDKRKVS